MGVNEVVVCELFGKKEILIGQDIPFNATTFALMLLPEWRSSHTSHSRLVTEKRLYLLF
jgi:hypothetical protein